MSTSTKLSIDPYRPAPDAAVHLAADVVPTLANRDAKVAAVMAVIELARFKLAEDAEIAIHDCVTTHVLINGDRDPNASLAEREAWRKALDESVEEALAAHKAAIGEGPWIQNVTAAHLEDGDAPLQVATWIAETISKQWSPLPMHRGKFLSAAGVVAEHLAVIEEAAKAAPPAALPAAAAGTVAERPAPPVALPAGAVPPPPATMPPDAPAAAPPTAAPAAAPAALDLGVPGPEELKRAYMLWFHAAGPDATQMAAKLNVSVSTFRNWGMGRSTPKADAGHAQIIIADTDARMAELHEARNIFLRMI